MEKPLIAVIAGILVSSHVRLGTKNVEGKLESGVAQLSDITIESAVALAGKIYAAAHALDAPEKNPSPHVTPHA